MVDNLVTGHRSNLAHLEGKYDWIEGDLADFEVCRRAVEGVACVFHQAAIPSVPRSVEEPLLSHLTGPTATLNLLEAARLAGVRRFMFAASSSAYGETTELPKHEEILPQPLRPYAAGKLAGEAYVSVYARTMGLDGVSLRYFNIFGPRQDPSSPYSGVISIFAQAWPQASGPGHIRGRRPDPRLHLCCKCGRGKPGWPCCIQSRSRGRSTTSEPAGESACSTLSKPSTRFSGTELEPEFQPVRAGDVRDSQASLERIQQKLSYRPIVDFEQGLRLSLESVRPGQAAPR